jgi:hypothetical protein
MWIRTKADYPNLLNTDHYSSICLVEEDGDFVINAFFPNGDADWILRTKDKANAEETFSRLRRILKVFDVCMPEESNGK